MCYKLFWLIQVITSVISDYTALSNGILRSCGAAEVLP